MLVPYEHPAPGRDLSRPAAYGVSSVRWNHQKAAASEQGEHGGTDPDVFDWECREILRWGDWRA